LPKQNKGLATESLGYIVAGIIGVVVTAGVTSLLAKILGRQKKPKRTETIIGHG